MSHSQQSPQQKHAEYLSFLQQMRPRIIPNIAEMPNRFFESLRGDPSAWEQPLSSQQQETESTAVESSTKRETKTPKNPTINNMLAQAPHFSYLEASDITNFTNAFSCPLCSIHGVGTPCGQDIVADWKACSEMKAFFFGKDKGPEEDFDPDTVKIAKKWRRQFILERLSDSVQTEQEREKIAMQLEGYDERFDKADDFCKVFNDRFFGCMSKWMQTNPEYYQNRAGLMLRSFDFPVESTKFYLQMQRFKRYQDEGMLESQNAADASV